MFIGTINITSLLRAFKILEKFRIHDDTQQEKAGTIQAFEFCFELVWKTMKRLLEERGKIVNSPREAFRVAALEGFIKDPEVWFDFLKKRNITTHVYQEDEMEKVISVMSEFSLQVKDFFKNIGVPEDAY